MIKNKNGITLIALIITIIILLILAGVSASFIVGDNGIITNAMKMEEESAKSEVKNSILLLLNEELLCASAEIAGTTADIGTVYNEPAIINYLKGNKNYNGTDHVDVNATKCLEELNGALTITPIKIKEGCDDVEVKSKYKIITNAQIPDGNKICADGDKYGAGKDGEPNAKINIFTLEAIIEKDDGTHEAYSDSNKDKYKGKFDLKYYDKNGNSVVLETIALYVTNQS